MTTLPNQPAQKSSGQSNYVKWILIGCGALIVISIGLVLIVGGIWYLGVRSPRDVRRSPLFGSSEVKLVNNHGVETVQKTWSSCTAFAPADWTIVGNEQRVGIGVDLGAPD